MTVAGYAIFCFVLLGLSAIGCGLARTALRRFAVLDRPNERSNHGAPVPRGAGLVLVPLLLAGFALAPLIDPAAMGLPGAILIGAILLAAVSWWDDLRGLGVLPRLAVQAAAVLLGLATLLHRPPVFQGLLPQPLDLALAGLAWVWFVNLFNFMDGSDAMAGTETTMIGLGLALVAFELGGSGLSPLHGLALAAVALGFLVWNRPPATLFLGDVGSVPLGYLVGWLLLVAASEGAWAAALILPAYYLADSGVTLARRCWRRAPILEAHSEHFYQQAIRHGRSHGKVALAVLIADLALVGLALGAVREEPLVALGGAALVCWLLIRVLARPPGSVKPRFGD